MNITRHPRSSLHTVQPVRAGHSGGAQAGLLLAPLAALAVLALQPAPVQAQTQTPAAAPAPEPAKVGVARTLPNGVEVTLTRAGRAPLSYPAATDSVRVHYEGTFEDGRVFDSSYERKQPATFPLNR
ncbi:MAG: FKBP-type peptidyl-prolyl cis-trans isomerase, partial [Betaproteobacteria bacterium]